MSRSLTSGTLAQATAIDRFMAKVSPEPMSGCWLWSGALADGGYGAFRGHEGKSVKAHRWFYEQNKGPVPDGLELDHRCRVRSCVNPEHLEPVTRRVNTLRGISPAAINATKTHCVRGHPLFGPNLYLRRNGQRGCRSCLTAQLIRFCARPHAIPAACTRGHAMIGSNVYRHTNGRILCRACRKETNRLLNLRKKRGL